MMPAMLLSDRSPELWIDGQVAGLSVQRPTCPASTCGSAALSAPWNCLLGRPGEHVAMGQQTWSLAQSPWKRQMAWGQGHSKMNRVLLRGSGAGLAGRLTSPGEESRVRLGTGCWARGREMSSPPPCPAAMLASTPAATMLHRAQLQDGQSWKAVLVSTLLGLVKCLGNINFFVLSSTRAGEVSRPPLPTAHRLQ
ncbi:hypothetical protein H1C71_041768 [Ictidomys tridecemlineatus]|nr:hypothetical protein H1C71_041768 [Ictidomys tridecemlineatus]